MELPKQYDIRLLLYTFPSPSSVPSIPFTGKAMGGASGGYTTGPRSVIDILRNKARPYLFSNSIAPPLVAAAITAFEKIMKSTELRDKLESNTKLFRQLMKENGFNLGDTQHPIVPIMLGKLMCSNNMYLYTITCPTSYHLVFTCGLNIHEHFGCINNLFFLHHQCCLTCLLIYATLHTICPEYPLLRTALLYVYIYRLFLSFIIAGDAKLASEFAKEMLKEGIYVVAFSYPVVPQGKARIRVQISAGHSEDAIRTCVKAFTDVRKRLTGQ